MAKEDILEGETGSPLIQITHISNLFLEKWEIFYLISHTLLPEKATTVCLSLVR
ncbi:MAG: hypothetical protein GVY17_06855 [Cyanobacteria bacterium]|nr:hypothetical protein [Cyanobacteria bacterium GSL.Bin21]